MCCVAPEAGLMTDHLTQILERSYTQSLVAFRLFLAPDGEYVLTVEQKKSLQLFRVGDLKSAVGVYAMYGEVENVTFTSDSSHIIFGISDTRLFFLLICDPKVPSHSDRIKVSCPLLH
mgnify:FL=1